MAVRSCAIKELQLITAVLLPVASVIIVFVVRMAELGTKPDTVPGPVKEDFTLNLFVLAGVLMLGGSILEFLWRKPAWNWGWLLAGWTCAGASFWIRRRAIVALGRFWSLHVEIRENHEFIRSGPFRWVRHPVYLSMILELVSGALFLRAFDTLATVSLLFVPTLVFRIRLEESALIDKFGDAYRDYRRRTPALFPHKSPLPA
ncbi:MAG: methyltransferase family protein [Limisphaerales bacterium]